MQNASNLVKLALKSCSHEHWNEAGATTIESFDPPILRACQQTKLHNHLTKLSVRHKKNDNQEITIMNYREHQKV